MAKPFCHLECKIEWGNGEIPEKVPKEHWSCEEVSELATKHGALKKLPEKETLEEKEPADSLQQRAESRTCG